MERKYNSINCYFYYDTIPSTYEVNTKHTGDQWNSNIDEIIEKLGPVGNRFDQWCASITASLQS